MFFLKRFFKKKINGFFTVEYSMLIPIVIMVYAFLITISLELYNSVVLKGNTYITEMEALNCESEECYEADRWSL